jgi:hypothetical protein
MEGFMSSPADQVSGVQDSGLTEATRDLRIDLSRSVLRLAVGGSLEAVDAVRRWLEDREAARPELSPDDRLAPEETSADRALHGAVGLLFASFEVVRRGCSRVADASGPVARLFSKAFSPALDRWVQAGRVESRRSRSLARSVAVRGFDRVVGQLSGSREVDGLVRELAARYLSHLEEHPEEAEALVRSQGDRYIDYLRRHPGMVQELVSGQSSGLASELIDGVRARAVTADGVFEAIARSILHRTPRERLPGPSPAVRRRAERATVPSDLEPPRVDEDAAG